MKTDRNTIIAGWLCLAIGLLLMWRSLWLFIMYGPLFLAALILAIVLLGKGQIKHGFPLLLTMVIAVPVIWVSTGLFRAEAVLQNTAKSLENSRREVQLELGRSTFPTQSGEIRTEQIAINPPSQSVSTPPLPPKLDYSTYYSDDLQNAKAPEIGIVASKMFADDCEFRPKGAFSRDGELFVYTSKSSDSRLRGRHLTIRSARAPNPIIASYVISDSPTHLIGWSPDGNRIAYVDSSGHVHILDRASANDVTLPNLTLWLSNFDNSKLAWDQDSVVELVGQSSTASIDLDTIKATGKEHNVPMTELELMVRQKLFGDNIHKNAWVGTNLELKSWAIMEVGGSWSKMIPREIAYTTSTSLWASPELRHLIVAQDSMAGSRLTLYILGRRVAAERTFEFRVPDISELYKNKSDSKKELFAKILQKGRFFTKIYAPQTNPLNGKVIGGDWKRPLALLRVTQIHGGSVTASVEQEFADFSQYLAPGGSGIIVGPIFGDDGFGHSFEYPEDTWRLLKGSSN